VAWCPLGIATIGSIISSLTPRGRSTEEGKKKGEKKKEDLGSELTVDFDLEITMGKFFIFIFIWSVVTYCTVVISARARKNKASESDSKKS
jgi:hypothetical protein